ncbi:uncharacterized protein [Rhodnius prolixus]|uniref:uncharacterized protein n=1 Tax=Rhodnius prolixus TaxID=13249 RepID=UPI003D189616
MANSNSIPSNIKPKVLRVPLHTLQIAAMWPPFTINRVIKTLMRIYLVSSAILLALCTVGLLVKTITTKDLVDRSEAIDIITLTSSALYKQLFFVKHYNELNDLVMTADILEVPVGWLKYPPYLSAAHCTCGFLAIGFWWMVPILKVSFGITTLPEMRLPMNVYDWGPTGWQFCAIYVCCCFGLAFSTHVYMAVDGFLFTAVYTANGALKLLADRIMKIRSIKTEGKETLNEIILSELKKCAKTHARILQFIRKLEVIFRSLIVADVLHAIISLSFAMLQMSESKGILEWTKMVFFIFYCFLHQYLNSFFGQDLINKQENLRYVLEEVPWEECSLPVRSTTLIMITATTNPIKLSAWRMYFLQYATFSEFVKNMISTYMVLRQLQDNSI